MWPWGHFAVAYICYVCWLTLAERQKQTVGLVCVLALGSQLPDLIDKPLAWSLQVLPSGRSLGHSLITVTLVIVILTVIASKTGYTRYVLALAIGWISHVVSDLGLEVLLGLAGGDLSQFQWTTYLLWPVLAPPDYASDDSFGDAVAGLALSSVGLAEIGMGAAVVGVWLLSNGPGSYRIRSLFVKVLPLLQTK